ncbi:MAG TPA: YbaB/EbfC family nucleoid-associated protein [Ruminococcaceae bacterium]|nr:YbaB/EbfC family nucleoid-associated protein [Oscillospiraceae bacterium]
MKARLPKGFGGGASDMGSMLKQAQKMQENMNKLQAELEEKEYAVTSGGGMVEVQINGKREILSVNIKPEAVDPDDIEMLQDLVVAGVNEAIRKVDEVTATEMGKLTGGMNIPGLA